MTKEQYQAWIAGVQFSNSLMHMSKSEFCSPIGLSAKPDEVRTCDAHAARLLEKARAAHDELTAYVTSRTEEGR